MSQTDYVPDVSKISFKMYRVSLLDKEIMQNFIADAPNVDEMLARYERNDIYNSDGTISIEKLMVAAPNLHIITIETGGFPGDKGSVQPPGGSQCQQEGCRVPYQDLQRQQAECEVGLRICDEPIQGDVSRSGRLQVIRQPFLQGDGREFPFQAGGRQDAPAAQGILPDSFRGEGDGACFRSEF